MPRIVIAIVSITALISISVYFANREVDPATPPNTFPTSNSSRNRQQPKPPEIEFVMEEEADREIAQKAIQVLFNRCRMDEVMPDMQEIQVTMETICERQPCTHYLWERYKWRRVVRVEPTFRNTIDLQNKLFEPQKIAGNRFDFRLGGGASPGITADKWIGQSLCEMQAEPGATGYIEVPYLKFIR